MSVSAVKGKCRQTHRYGYEPENLCTQRYLGHLEVREVVIYQARAEEVAYSAFVIIRTHTKHLHLCEGIYFKEGVWGKKPNTHKKQKNLSDYTNTLSTCKNKKPTAENSQMENDKTGRRV